MHAFTETGISDLILHHVGNQFHDELLQLGKTKLNFNEEVEQDLRTYFLSSFKHNEYYQLHHESNLQLNEVYSYAKAIFDNPENLQQQSENLAKHLYQHSTHPNTKPGEFYVVLLNNCLFDGEELDAIGLFKSENKETFLDIKYNSEGFEIQSQQGININKLDKGCVIFKTEEDSGYVLTVVDNTNKGSDAQYWFDQFLHVKQRQDEYFYTENILNMTKSFITKEFPEQFEADKVDQAEFMNKSAQYFKEQDQFNLDEFANEVIGQEDIIEQFKEYSTSYQKDRAIAVSDGFQISDTAVQKKARIFKSVIKLDKNFHVYVHGNRNKIERGEDDGGKFYKLYFDDER